MSNNNIQNSNYNWEAYVDNWSDGGHDDPTLPNGCKGNHAFAVPGADGSWDGDYLLYPTSDTKGLAIGGWNASQGEWCGSAADPIAPGSNPPGWWKPGQTNGFYFIMNTPDNDTVPYSVNAANPKGVTGAQARATFIQNIAAAAKEYGYSSVIMDYENYGGFNWTGDSKLPVTNPPTPKSFSYPPDSSIYTGFLKDLGTALGPNIPLEMPISPSITNQKFWNLTDLVQNTNIIFQPMCFDYGMGNAPSDPTTPVPVDANADVYDTMQYLEQLVNAGMPLDRMMIGLPAYGLAYNTQPGMTPDQIESGLKAKTLTGTYWRDQPIAQDGLGQMRNTDILNMIGNWETPNSPWTKIQSPGNPNMPVSVTNPLETYYYNSSTGLMIYGFPPETVQNLAGAVKAFQTEHSGQVKGFFEWEAVGDLSGSSSTIAEMMADMDGPLSGNLSYEQNLKQWANSHDLTHS